MLFKWIYFPTRYSMALNHIVFIFTVDITNIDNMLSPCMFICHKLLRAFLKLDIPLHAACTWTHTAVSL